MLEAGARRGIEASRQRSLSRLLHAAEGEIDTASAGEQRRSSSKDTVDAVVAEPRGAPEHDHISREKLDRGRSILSVKTADAKNRGVAK